MSAEVERPIISPPVFERINPVLPSKERQALFDQRIKMLSDFALEQGGSDYLQKVQRFGQTVKASHGIPLDWLIIEVQERSQTDPYVTRRRVAQEKRFEANQALRGENDPLGVVLSDAMGRAESGLR